MTRDTTLTASFLDPADVADDLLYRTGQAMLANDFDSFVACFTIPHLLETTEGKRVLETINEFRNLFECIHGSFKKKGLAQLVRTVESAEFLEDGVIGSTHLAAQFNGEGQRICTPYPVYSIIKSGMDGIWRIESSIYAIIDDFEMNILLHRAGSPAAP